MRQLTTVDLKLTTIIDDRVTNVDTDASFWGVLAGTATLSGQCLCDTEGSMANSKIHLIFGAAAIAAMITGAASGAPRRRHAAPVAKTEIGDTGTYQYKVQAGDTLRRIAADYFVNPRDQSGYRAVWAINHVQDPNHLAVGSTLTIPRRLLIVVPARAQIAAFHGTVTVGPDRPAKVGMVVTEGARIQTGANSSVSFTLEDGSAVTLPSQSIFSLERMRLVLISGELQHVFRLDAGRSQFVVSPARGPAARFEVKTPVSVSAVRGTEFRIAVEDGGRASLAEVLKDNVLTTGSTGGVMINEGYGAKADEKGVGQPVKLLAFPEVILPVYHNADGSLTFNVKPIEGAVRYHLQIASDLAFQDVREEGVSPKPTFGFPKSPVGNYYVRVTAIDAQGLEGRQHIYPFEYHR